MTQHPVADDAPGTVLFPEYESLYDLVAAEVRGLAGAQLDFESERWEWSKWSIRRQLSHMASLIYRWLLIRWGVTLFPEGGHGVEDVPGLAESAFDRRMDERRYWQSGVVMGKLKTAIELAEGVLSERNAGYLRRHTLTRDHTPEWALMSRAHPTGIYPSDDPSKSIMTLEASMRHIYFEEITHLYNIQRLKRAQGLATAVDLPRVGYWTLEEWDTSEPGEGVGC